MNMKEIEKEFLLASVYSSKNCGQSRTEDAHY